MAFMYVTTIAASLVTAWNLFNTIAIAEGQSGVAVAGAWAMIVVAVLLVVAALVIAYDGLRAYGRYRQTPIGEMPPAPTAGEMR
jgi:hypothetical protein